ncbi:hypothetical protein FRC17_008250 [Serendipita sp. 399]|nr:hypothetical protein FRC17_008250 [Serendipita sp. 399]
MSATMNLNRVLNHVPAPNLDLYAVKIPIPSHTSSTVAEIVAHPATYLENGVLLDPLEAVAERFPDVAHKEVHIIVQLPSVSPCGISSASGLYTVFCVIKGQNTTFSIEIAGNKTIDFLKKKIKEKNTGTLANIDARELTLFKVDLKDDEYLMEDANKRMEEHPPALRPTKKLAQIFDGTPAEDTVHIVVQLPIHLPPYQESMDMERKLSSSSGFGQDPVMSAQSPVAEIDKFTTHRLVTVGALYERLCRYHFILVRGTPASGKSTLAQLLEKHIRLKEPSTNPISIDNWPMNGSSWVLKLTEMFNPNGPNTIIIDEGQLTYWDTNHGDNVAQAGLLLLPDEFHDLVKRRCPEHRFKEDFLDYIYGFTAGHVGATRDLLTIVLEHDSYRRTQEHNGEYSLKAFHEEFPVKALWDRLESGSRFRRGLPMLGELQDVNIARVFRTALSNNHVMEELLETSEDIQILQVCFRSGWLHAISQDNKSVFVFTTELHREFVEYHLGKDIIPPDLIGDNLLLFSLDVIRRFGRLQLSNPRTIGLSALQRPPEAQYRDEFYRCCYLHTNGALLSFPGYGNVSGRTDFYIPRKKWGIELLRDGDRLEQHSGRFSDQSAYAKDFDVSDHIILDFRVRIPKKPHANIANLYHVVFRDDFSRVDILDNALVLVDSFVLLNH